MTRSLVLLLEAVAKDPDAPIGQAEIQFPMGRNRPLHPRGKTPGARPTISPAGTPPEAEPGAGTPLQETLRGLFAEILHRTHVNIHDDFFILGGHSLAATRLISRIRSVLGVKLGVREFFDEPTVAGVSRKLSASPQQDPLPPISRR
jgi:acyl carrier protein